MQKVPLAVIRSICKIFSNRRPCKPGTGLIPSRGSYIIMNLLAYTVTVQKVESDGFQFLFKVSNDKLVKQ